MFRGIRYLTCGITAFVLIVGGAQATTHDFYKGKTIRIVVGFSAGGGFDIYSRTIARHIRRHIAGSPTVIVENMPGAGSLISANYVYKVAKPDGLTIGNFIGSMLLAQLRGQPGVEFDARKFAYVGIPSKDTPVCVFTKASGITSLERWRQSKAPLKIGGLGTGTPQDNIPKILKTALGFPIHLVSGYKGVADMRLAAEAGEVAGLCLSWDAVKATWGRALEAGEVVVVLQLVPKAHAELPKVPAAIDLAKSDEDRQLIDAGAQVPAAINRPYLLPPGTAKEQVQVLRKAFMDTMHDPEFLADARKSKLELDPMSGEDLEDAVARLFSLSPAVVTRLKDILK